MKRGGAKRVGAGREKSPSFQNNKRNESTTLQSKSSLYIFGKLIEKGYVYLEKSSCLGLEPSAMIKTSCHFSPSPIMILRIRKYSSMFGFTWTSLSVNFQWHIKNMSALIWLWVYNHYFGLQLGQLHKVCLNIPDALVTFWFTRVSCDMQIS